jgi:hypothetical protein
MPTQQLLLFMDLDVKYSFRLFTDALYMQSFGIDGLIKAFYICQKQCQSVIFWSHDCLIYNVICSIH